MSIKLTKRLASELLGRGRTSIRIKESGLAEAEKAITREDVRKLIKDKSVYALEAKHNVSKHSKDLKEKKAQGRRRGKGKRKGSIKSRASVEYKKKVRAQRRVLEVLKSDNTINNDLFKSFYRLVKGGTFVSKASLLSHIQSKGVKIDDERMKKLKHT